MPFDYYSMPFCKPPEGVQRATSTINPGTILLGIKIQNSPYNFTIMASLKGKGELDWGGLHGGMGAWRQCWPWQLFAAQS